MWETSLHCITCVYCCILAELNLLWIIFQSLWLSLLFPSTSVFICFSFGVILVSISVYFAFKNPHPLLSLQESLASDITTSLPFLFLLIFLPVVSFFDSALSFQFPYMPLFVSIILVFLFFFLVHVASFRSLFRRLEWDAFTLWRRHLTF